METFLSKEDAAETFNKQFSSVFKANNGLSHEARNKRCPEFTDVRLFESDFENVIKKAANESSVGLDGIPYTFLKLSPAHFAKPLAFNFNFIFEKGEPPADWKTARVIPAFKNKGSESNVENYRPINLTFIPGKIVEAIVEG